MKHKNALTSVETNIHVEHDKRIKYSSCDGSEELSLQKLTVYYELKELLDKLKEEANNV